MKKILLILTGGTIGSKLEQQKIDVDSQAAYWLTHLYREKYGDSLEFEVIQPLNVLSENMVPSYWTTLSAVLTNVNCEDYQGIIITHGSDTLAYTSALIGMAFHHLPIPIVLIAANYPLKDPRSNGLKNFRSAVCLIIEGRANGVFTVYQNAKEENEVFLATRLLEADSYRDQFRSYGGSCFGRIVNDHLVLNESEENPTLEEVNQKKQHKLILSTPLKPAVQMIRPYPGMNYRCFDLQHAPKAILHYLYHSSTACTEGNEYSLLSFMEQCRQREIDVYVASAKKIEQGAYVTSHSILQYGAIPLFNISAEAAYCKLFLLYNQSKTVTRQMLQENLYFEKLPAICSNDHLHHREEPGNCC